jgi:putative transposase
MKQWRHQFPVDVMARVFASSRNGCYGWVKGIPAARTQQDERLKVAILAAHTRSRETYGVRRLQPELAFEGFIAGRDRIARVRRVLGLRGRQKRKFKATTHSNQTLPVAENLLDQQFAPTAPNQVWVTAITYIPTDEGWLYLAGLKDVFTCEIVGYAMSDRMTQELTARALYRAVQQQRPPASLTHHTDRGSQYCAHDYRALIDPFGLRASMSRKGNGYDNAPVESFWGSLKHELVHHRRFTTRTEAESAIREYLEIFYNRQRRHSRLGYVAPAIFVQNLANAA